VVKQGKNENLTGVLFVLPAIIGFVAFSAGPMIASFILSFTNYTIIKPVEFIGLRNYLEFFRGQDTFFYNSIKVTVLFAIMNVIVCIGVAFTIALILNNKKIKGLPLLRAVFYVPTIVPIIATAMIYMWMMSPDFGVFNAILRNFSIPPGKWIYSEKSVLPSLLFMTAWCSGNIMVVFLAGLQGIPKQLYEAIMIDGGNVFIKFQHVTLPMMTPTIFFNMVMFFISSMQAFLQAYIMTQGGPNNSTNFIVYYLYRQAFEFGEVGKANTLGWILFIMIVSVSALLFWSSKFWVLYGDE
jgi:multiple sugar transport system permease protein